MCGTTAIRVCIEAELPGVDDKDVTITLANGVLTIKGEKRSERDENRDSYHLSERSWGTFERSVRLPDTVDEAKLKASFDKGVLTIIAGKRPDAVQQSVASQSAPRRPLSPASPQQ